MDEVTTRYIIIAACVIVSISLLLLGAARGWLKNMRLGKEGITFQGVEKQVKLSNFNKLLDDEISELDEAVKEKSTTIVNNLRRIFNTSLDPVISHPGVKRIIGGAIRTPVYNASRRNNFKMCLRPENIKNYIARIMGEIKDEYEDAALAQKQFDCPIHGGRCVEYPPFSTIEKIIENKIIHNWAIPLRNFQIETHKEKIDLYQQFIGSYQELGDEFRIKITEQCIDKNNKYIEGLSRRPEAHEL